MSWYPASIGWMLKTDTSMFASFTRKHAGSKHHWATQYVGRLKKRKLGDCHGRHLASKKGMLAVKNTEQ